MCSLTFTTHPHLFRLASLAVGRIDWYSSYLMNCRRLLAACKSPRLCFFGFIACPCVGAVSYVVALTLAWIDIIMDLPTNSSIVISSIVCLQIDLLTTWVRKYVLTSSATTSRWFAVTLLLDFEEFRGMSRYRSSPRRRLFKSVNPRLITQIIDTSFSHHRREDRHNRIEGKRTINEQTLPRPGVSRCWWLFRCQVHCIVLTWTGKSFFMNKLTDPAWDVKLDSILFVHWTKSISVQWSGLGIVLL